MPTTFVNRTAIGAAKRLLLTNTFVEGDKSIPMTVAAGLTALTVKLFPVIIPSGLKKYHNPLVCPTNPGFVLVTVTVLLIKADLMATKLVPPLSPKALLFKLRFKPITVVSV